MISRRTQIELRETLVCFSKQQITDLFDGVGLQPCANYKPGELSIRREHVERYYGSIDFTAPAQTVGLLQICSEVVRDGRCNVEKLLAALRQDGYEWVDGQFVSAGSFLLEGIAKLAQLRNLPELTAQVNRLAKAIESDPPLAVGAAKDMVESVCKTILGELGVPVRNEALPKMVRVTAKNLGLAPADVPNQTKGEDAIRRVLNSLAQIADGMARLRNLYGTGHGRAGGVTGGVTARHARLAVGSAASLAVFLLETHTERLVDVTDASNRSQIKPLGQ